VSKLKKPWFIALVLLLLFSILPSAFADDNGQNKDKGLHHKRMELGIDVLLKDQLNLIKGKRVGLITNPTGVDGNFKSDVDLLFNNPNVNLTALYGPEHGVRGSEQAGGYVPYYIDDETGLPVYSLYGPTKKPTPDMLKNVDVLLFDIQDVGTRFYTYIYTMAYAMQAAAENHIPFIVLDRPNPLGGDTVEGPVLEPKYSSFVGMYPIPLRHGMTVGELAKLFNKEFNIGADLTVVEMKGWKRSMYFDDTTAPWVLPSPNMPTLDTALVYPGAALIEGTNVSEGRGTTRPFELIGAPFINGLELANQLNGLNLPGVKFRSASFEPTFSKFQGELCNGIQIHVTDKEKYEPVLTGIAVVKAIHDLYPSDFQFRAENSQGISYFDQLIGNGWVRSDIENRVSLQDIQSKWQKGLEDFMKIREKYLIYN